MDTKYYALVEIIAFAVVVLGFCGYQIWTVRKKPDEVAPKPSASEGAKSDNAGK